MSEQQSLSDTGDELTLREMARKLGIDYARLVRICRRGMIGLSGRKVVMRRWKTERGYVTNMAAVLEFRSNLNNPEYVPPHLVSDKESSESDQTV